MDRASATFGPSLMKLLLQACVAALQWALENVCRPGAPTWELRQRAHKQMQVLRG